MFVNEYPYTDFHELNLDYILKSILHLQNVVNDFVKNESMKIADPIGWDITKQYAKNTIVLDYDGNAYLSLKPVPEGISLNNDEYWLPVFNFMSYVRSFDSNLTFNVERNTERASKAYYVGDWVLINDLLYEVVADIPDGGTFNAGVNIERMSVEQFCRNWTAYASNLIATYKAQIDASEAAYKAEMLQQITTVTAALQAQLDEAISGVTVDSEVINGRVGYDGTTYATIGDAIRGQVSDLHDEIDTLDVSETFNLVFEQGNIDALGRNITSTTRIRTDYIRAGLGWTFSVPAGFEAYIRYYTDKYDQAISGNSGTWRTGTVTIFEPGVNYIRIIVGRVGESAITPEDITTPIAITTKNITDASVLMVNKAADAQGSREKLDAYTNNDPVTLIFEQGGIDSYGNNVTSTSTIRTGFMRCDQGYEFTVPINYKVIIRFFSDDVFNFITTSTSWLTGHVVADHTDAKFMRLIMKKNDETNITPATAPTFAMSARTSMDGAVIYGGTDTMFPRFRDAMAFLATCKNTTMIIKQGTYDLNTEYASELAADDDTRTFGPVLGGGNKLIFENYAKVICNNTDPTPHLQFSLLHIIGDCEIVNAQFECTNIRYCVHDDFLRYYSVYGISSAKIHSVKYTNCRMEHKGYYGLSDYGTPACIGSAPGLYENMVVDGGYYKSKKGSGSWYYPIFMHNKQNRQNAHVIVKDAYFDQGTFAITDMSETTCGIDVMLSGNRFAYAPIFNDNGGASSPLTHIEWNNIIE